MDNNTIGKLPDSLIVTLGSSEYAVAAGSSVEIVVTLSNQGSDGDYFKVNLLGIPPGWIDYSGPPAVWIPEGGQESVTFKITPSISEGSITGNYLIRLHAFGQTAPEKGKKLEILLRLLPAAKTKSTIEIRVESKQIKVVPGSEIKIQLAISNLSPEAESLELSIQGVPTSWVSIPSPVISVPGGIEKKVEIILQVPSVPEIRTGTIPVKISVTSQKHPMIKEEVELNLALATFESQGRVGVMLGSVQFSSAPGETLNIPISLLNRGKDSDTFRLGVEGIPVSWVSTTTPVILLKPGENKEISLLIRPTLSPSSQAGRYKFYITVTSLAAPDEGVKVDCLLTVAAYNQFTAALEPQTAKGGQPVTVTVKNDGNIQQVFTLNCVSEEDQLLFEFLPPEAAKQVGSLPETQSNAPKAVPVGVVPEPTVLTIPAGKSAAFRFTAQPRQRPLIGGSATYPYTVLVNSPHMKSAPMQAQLIGQAMIPIWVLPLALFMCILVFTLAIILGRQSGTKAGSATQTYLAATAQGTGISQTSAASTARALEATQTFAAELGQAISTTQTAAASTALAAAATQTATAATAQVIGATQTAAVGTLQAVAASETFAAYQTSVATQQTPTFTPTFTPSMTPTVQPPGTPTQVQLPRFGGVILFVSDRDGNQEIYNMDDAGHINRMTDNPAVDTSARLVTQYAAGGIHHQPRRAE